MSGWKKYVSMAGHLAEGAIATGVSVTKAFKKSDKGVVVDESETLEFTYVGTTDHKEYKGRMFYTDEYFAQPSTVYNPSLATASLSLAMSCGTRAENYQEGYANVQTLMGRMGFTDIGHNDSYESLSSLDTIGVAIGSKVLGDCTLLCMGIRGIGYGSEWGSNLLLGTGRFHQGFDEASDRALAYLAGYLAEHEIHGRLKLWVTGYSRSAATTNLVSGKLDTAIAEGRVVQVLGENVDLVRDDLYAYCFEPAETVEKTAFDIHGENYSNIWNHINPNDPVPIIVTACFGLERFGIDIDFPAAEDSNYEGRRDRMLGFYSRLQNRDELGHYRTDFFSAIDVNLFHDGPVTLGWTSQADFLRELNQKFADSLGSREHYCETIQTGLSNCIANMKAYGGNAKFLECLREAISKDRSSLISLVSAVGNNDPYRVKRALKDPVKKALHKSDMDKALADDMTTGLTEVIMVFREFITDNKLLAFNFLINTKTIFYAHYPELILSWLMSFDPNYCLV